MLKFNIRFLMILSIVSFSLTPTVGLSQVKTGDGSFLMLQNGETVSLGEFTDSADTEYEEVMTEAGAVALMNQLSPDDRAHLSQKAKSKLSSMKLKYNDGGYCKPVGRVTMAISVGLAVSIVLIPVSILLLIASVPLSAIDKLSGCKVILDL